MTRTGQQVQKETGQPIVKFFHHSKLFLPGLFCILTGPFKNQTNQFF